MGKSAFKAWLNSFSTWDFLFWASRSVENWEGKVEEEKCVALYTLWEKAFITWSTRWSITLPLSLSRALQDFAASASLLCLGGCQCLQLISSLIFDIDIHMNLGTGVGHLIKSRSNNNILPFQEYAPSQISTIPMSSSHTHVAWWCNVTALSRKRKWIKLWEPYFCCWIPKYPFSNNLSNPLLKPSNLMNIIIACLIVMNSLVILAIKGSVGTSITNIHSQI